MPAWIRDAAAGEQRVAVAAIRALGRSRDRRAVAELIFASRAPRAPEVRMRAVEALGAIGDDCAASAVAHALSDPDSHVRERACHALAKLAASDHLDEIARLLGDADRRVRMAAISAVSTLTAPAQISSAMVANLWAAALDDPFEPVRTLAAEALAGHGATGADAPVGAALERGGVAAERARHAAQVVDVTRARRG